MLRILRFIITGDWHLCKWETVDTYKLYRDDPTRPYNVQYHCKCSICGKHEKFH